MLTANAVQCGSLPPLAAWKRVHHLNTTTMPRLPIWRTALPSMRSTSPVCWPTDYLHRQTGLLVLASAGLHTMWSICCSTFLRLSAPRQKRLAARSESEADQFAQAAGAEYVWLDSCSRNACEIKEIRFLHFFQTLLPNTRKTITLAELRPRIRESLRSLVVFNLILKKK